MKAAPKYAWHNGEIVPWDDARVHARSEGFMRGASVFEGIRAYQAHDGSDLYVFRNDAHLRRMFDTSMKILRMQMAWTREEISEAIAELLRANDFHQDVHIRPQAYFGASTHEHSYLSSDVEVGCVITAVERPHRRDNVHEGVAVRISTWRRLDDQTSPPRVKAGGNYLNSRYAAVEASVDGYDSALLLDASGKVAEGPGACVMMVRDGAVVTPPSTSGTLESITLDTLKVLMSRELSVPVIEREIDRTELYVADELFFAGTGHEIQPITSVDRYPVGDGTAGRITNQIRDIYLEVVRGHRSGYAEWLQPVYAAAGSLAV